jgi:gamma-glutamylputrescine oxidase
LIQDVPAAGVSPAAPAARTQSKAVSARPFWLAQSDDAVVPDDDVSTTADVVVVGGGIVGVATAYWLAKRGVAVQLLEAAELCFGATGRNIGLFLAGLNPIETPEVVETVCAEEGISAGGKVVGHLALASSPSVWDRIRSEARARGGRIEALDRKDCEALVRGPLADEICGGRWYRDGRVIDPVRLTRGLARAAHRLGARISVRQRVRRIETRAGLHMVCTGKSRIAARHVVVACNAWSSLLIPELGMLIEPRPGQVFATDPVSPALPFGLALDWGTIYWRQAPNGAILAGGLGQLDRPSDPRRRQRVNHVVQREVARALERIFPGRRLPPVRTRWAGLMDATPDGRPIVDRVPENGVWVAAGLAGHGLPPAFGIGRAIASSLCAGTIAAEIMPYGLARFADRLAAPCPTSAEPPRRRREDFRAQSTRHLHKTLS